LDKIIYLNAPFKILDGDTVEEIHYYSKVKYGEGLVRIDGSENLYDISGKEGKILKIDMIPVDESFNKFDIKELSEGDYHSSTLTIN